MSIMSSAIMLNQAVAPHVVGQAAQTNNTEDTEETSTTTQTTETNDTESNIITDLFKTETPFETASAGTGFALAVASGIGLFVGISAGLLNPFWFFGLAAIFVLSLALVSNYASLREHRAQMEENAQPITQEQVREHVDDLRERGIIPPADSDNDTQTSVTPGNELTQTA